MFYNIAPVRKVHRSLMYPAPELNDILGGNLPSNMQTQMLTVWRTLWVELDQMAEPIIQTAPNAPPSPHGFIFATKAVYDTSDPNDIKVTSGDWDTWSIVGEIPMPPFPNWGTNPKEPQDFDVVYVEDGTIVPQPLDFPDISLAQEAMKAACIDVKEATPAIITSWGLVSRETTPFVRNLPAVNAAALVTIGTASRDVTLNELTFWCIQGVGAYESKIDETNDTGIGGACGRVTGDGTGIFLIFNETIRDLVTTVMDITRTVSEMNRLVTFHEILHLFGFVDEYVLGLPNHLYNPLADGPIMTSEWYRSQDLIGYTTLNDHQIRKIQSRNYPH